MIPRALILNWRQVAPWAADEQVEQDLILSRALVDLFSDDYLSKELAFRGGTALHKLFVPTAARHSEDIDLVQVKQGPIGNILDKVREKVDPWLGNPKRRLGHGRATLIYRYQSINPIISSMSLKIEINTREHFSLLGHQKIDFSVENPWFQGSAKLTTFSIEELLATKFRALYQRKKGRDLFDLALCYKMIPTLKVGQVIDVFQSYMKHENKRVTRAEFESNLLNKFSDKGFQNDILPLLS